MFRRYFAAAAIIGLTAMAAVAAHAQLPGPGPVPVTAETPGDFFDLIRIAVQDLDTVQLPPVVASLTTGTNAPQYVPNPPPLDTIGSQVSTGVSGQNVEELMPVTQGLPCKSYDQMLVVAKALQENYLSAMATAESFANQVQGENLAQIAANIQAPAQLASTQGNGQAILALIQEVRMERGQIASLEHLIAVEDLHQLDSWIRLIMPRDKAGCR